MMAKRKKYDKEAIEREYRAGQLSIREISRQHGCAESSIRLWASKGGWERDLSEKVRKRAQTKLMRREMRTSNVSEDEIIEAAAERSAAIQEIHRRDIRSLRELVAKLRNEVDAGEKLYITQYQGQIVEKTVSLTASEKASAVANLAQAEHKLVALERQAYSMDEPEGGDGKEPEFTETEREARLASMIETAIRRKNAANG